MDARASVCWPLKSRLRERNVCNLVTRMQRTYLHADLRSTIRSAIQRFRTIRSAFRLSTNTSRPLLRLHRFNPTKLSSEDEINEFQRFIWENKLKFLFKGLNKSVPIYSKVRYHSTIFSVVIFD